LATITNESMQLQIWNCV